MSAPSKKNTFIPLPAQKEFMRVPHNKDIDIALYQGGKGSGKTACGVTLAILLCEQFPGITGIAGANTYSVLEGSLIPEYTRKLKFFGYNKPKDYTFNEQKKHMKFANGSSIFFRYFSDLNSFKGIDAGFVQIDEMSDIPESSFVEALARLRQAYINDGKTIPTRRLFGHTNPQLGKGWIYEYFYKDCDDEELVEYKQHSRKRYYKRISKINKINIASEGEDPIYVEVPYRLIIAPTIQNIHTQDAQIAALKDKYDPILFNINVMGEFGEYTQGLVCKSFSFQHNVMDFIEIDRTQPLYLCCDFNVDPMCWEIAQRINGDVYFIDEYAISDTHTMKTLELFMRDYPSSIYPYIIINGDATGNKKESISPDTHYSMIYTALTSAGYSVELNILSRNPYKAPRIAAWNGKMKNARGERKIKISRNCPRLIHDCENLIYKEGTSEMDIPSHMAIKRDPKLKWVGHSFDAASYHVHYYDPVTMEDEFDAYKDNTIILPKDSRFGNRYNYGV